MPLSQSDPALDYGGSWGDASKGWPEMLFQSREHAEYAHYVSHKFAKVPYGSYVLVDRTLRLEKTEYVEKVRSALRKRPYKEGWKDRIRG